MYRWRIARAAALVAFGGHLMGGAAGQTATSATPDAAPLGPSEASITAVYRREFGVPIVRPAVFRAECAGIVTTTTTAYVDRVGARARLVSLRLNSDEWTILGRSESPSTLIPAGMFATLVVVVAYPQTVSSEASVLLAAAQDSVNGDHERFASSQRYNRSVVSFRNTNLLLAPSSIGDPTDPESVRDAADRAGANVDEFTFLMAIDINPGRTAGGFARSKFGFVYVGNYGGWQQPLTREQWRRVARTAYHHEVAHHWGWPAAHDWVSTCSGQRPWMEPFAVPPVLFGWHDVDGDSVPEIADPTPYGVETGRGGQ